VDPRRDGAVAERNLRQDVTLRAAGLGAVHGVLAADLCINQQKMFPTRSLANFVRSPSQLGNEPGRWCPHWHAGGCR